QRTRHVDIRWAPDVFHPFEDGMIFHRVVDDAPGALFSMVAVMVDPGIAQDLPAKAAGPLLAAPIPLGVGALFVARNGKRMRRGAQAEDRLPRIHVVDDVFHLVGRWFAEAG